jgi:hypothetical protein
MPHLTHFFMNQHRRPSWLLWAMALPAGVLANAMAGGWNSLTDAMLMLAGWQHDPTLLQRYSAGVTSHLVVPSFLAFVLLRTTPLRTWLAPNRLAVGCLLLADALVLGITLRGLYRASMDSMPYLVQGSEPVQLLLYASFGVGVASLLLSTIWHRLVSPNAQVVLVVKSLMREL